MKIVTVKVEKGRTFRMAAALLGLVLLCLLLHSARSFLVTSGSRGPRYTGVETAEERIGFLAQFGWEVEPDPVEVLEILLPEEADEVLAEYERLQKAQGLSLEPYLGRRIKRYTYVVTNYPGAGDEPIRASLYIYKDKVIAGDICSLRLDGFMHGFLYE